MTDTQPPTSKREVIVLGAGVVALTTALKIQRQGSYRVTIIADVIPGDPKSIQYTSQWAGAHHAYNAIDESGLHELEAATFDVMWELSAPGSDAEESFLRMTSTKYYLYEAKQSEPLEKMPNFRYLSKDELIPGALSGCTFTTVSIDVPIYLNYLLTRFLACGGSILRGSVQHINQLIEGGAGLFASGAKHKALPEAIIVACGMGARFLGGVEDKNMYPVRGQTVIVRAPWVRFGRMDTTESGALTYIIPRRSSDVVVGGTRTVDDWFSKPRPETTEDILKRGFKLCPELAPPDVRAVRQPTLEDVLPHVVEEGCGLRPSRKGGIRLEVEWTEGVGGRGRVPLIHNYGHGGYGFQTSWGCADKVLLLLEQVSIKG